MLKNRDPSPYTKSDAKCPFVTILSAKYKTSLQSIWLQAHTCLLASQPLPNRLALAAVLPVSSALCDKVNASLSRVLASV